MCFGGLVAEPLWISCRLDGCEGGRCNSNGSEENGNRLSKRHAENTWKPHPTENLPKNLPENLPKNLVLRSNNGRYGCLFIGDFFPGGFPGGFSGGFPGGFSEGFP